MTKSRILLVSRNREDVRFWRGLAEEQGLSIYSAALKDDIEHYASTFPDCTVIWDGDNSTASELGFAIFPKYVKADRLIVVTDKPLKNYSRLYQYPLFSHHIMRRYPKASHEILGTLLTDIVARAVSSKGESSLLPQGSKIQALKLKNSAHKSAAIEAVRNEMVKQGLKGRLASSIAQAADELMLNALFDAPVDSKSVRYRHELDRGSDFELSEGEGIVLNMASSAQCLGISVTDPFGSLKRETIFSSLRHQYDTFLRSTGRGLGIAGVLETGISLAFRIRPGTSTTVTLVAPRPESYQEFRKSFRFLSVASGVRQR